LHCKIRSKSGWLSVLLEALKSYIGPKPVQKPHPPIYMGAFVPRALRRLAKYADGWNPVAIPLDGMVQMFESIKQLAREAGRDPSRIELVIRAHPKIADKPLEGRNARFSLAR
jgi:alkanesulfonate monooxygenase SsuD/methylene tetrahydromethanopterin reductase-like flavin-dependent oxidoreductase (luciferase family)